ncbi:MAG: hypothetical protein DBX55_01530 [Verrucomicrobia bacterium]|nr:MAG: hypothetical protein DBX55_01530 [Verrucomicrobiota bacterium]
MRCIPQCARAFGGNFFHRFSFFQSRLLAFWVLTESGSGNLFIFFVADAFGLRISPAESDGDAHLRARISFRIGARLGKAVRRGCCAAFGNVNFAAFVKFVSFFVPLLGRVKGDFYSIFIRLPKGTVFARKFLFFLRRQGGGTRNAKFAPRVLSFF